MSQVQLLSGDQAAEWRDALGRSYQHDCYHSAEYHALAESQGEGGARLLVYRDGDHQIALPFLVRSFASVPGLAAAPAGWRDVTSVYGYPGPVASHPEPPPRVVRGFQEAAQETLRGLGAVALFSRLHPFLPQADWLAGLGACQDTGETVAVDLTLPPDVQRSRYRRSHRESINRLRRQGLTARREPDLGRLPLFVRMYYETMRRVGAADWFFFPDSYFRGLAERLAPHVHLFFCELDGRPVCGGLFFSCGGFVQYHLGGALDEFLHLAPMKVLIDEVRVWGNETGARVLHLGGGTSSRPDDTLLYFKKGFSDQRRRFLTWRWVLRPDAYQELQRLRARWNEQNGCVPRVANYFPEYRCPTAPAGEAR